MFVKEATFFGFFTFFEAKGLQWRLWGKERENPGRFLAE